MVSLGIFLRVRLGKDVYISGGIGIQSKVIKMTFIAEFSTNIWIILSIFFHCESRLIFRQ